MSKQEKYLLLGFFIISLVAIILLAAGVSRLEFRPGKLFALETNLKAWTTVFGVYLLFLIFLYLYFRPKLKRGNTSKLKPPSLFSILAQIVLWIVALYFLRDKLHLEPFQQESIPAGQSASSIQSENLLVQDFISFAPPWLVYVASNLVILALLVLVWYWIKQRRKSTIVLNFLTREAKIAIEELKAGGEFRNAILRCYASMCDALDHRRSIHREVDMTPREFQMHLLQLGLPQAPVERITQLFEQVRYGNLSTDEEDEREAIACMVAIVQAGERRA